VCKATGAGQQCGTCVFAVRRVLCQHGGTSLSPAEVHVATG
jgi:bacterioferritin-associated ferredoxin